MTVTADNIIQIASGSTRLTAGGPGEPITCAFANPTGAASTVILVATADGDHSASGTLEAPAGFLAYSAAVAGRPWNQLCVYVLQSDVGSKTSWSLRTSIAGSTQQVVWILLEVTGVGVRPMDVIASPPNGWCVCPPSKVVNNTDVTVASWSSGTTDVAACFDLLGLSFHSATSATSTVPVISGHTNGFVEVASQTRSDASHSMALSVGCISSLAMAPYECTVSVSPSSYMCGYVLMFYSDTGLFPPDIITMFGAEIGTATNLSVGSPVAALGTAPFDTVVGTPAIVTTNARSGNYCLELASSAAIENVQWSQFGGLQNTGAFVNVGRFHFYFPTSRPAADTELWSTSAGTGTFWGVATIWYRAASQKLGVIVGTSGTEVLSSATIPVNTWVGIDYRHFTGSASAEHTYDWQIDYDATPGDATGPVVQTSAVGGGTSAQDVQMVRIGWPTARTATVRYDDIAIARTWGSYPIGDIQILPLKVDPAGTPTLTGTTANFKTFTTNGTTLAAWTAAATVTALNTIPPVVGSTATGLTQVNLAASDWVKIPMETYAAAPDYVLRAVRWYVAGWALTTTTATLAVRSGDGTDVLWDIPADDHNFDNASLRWLCGPQRKTAVGSGTAYQLTQSKLDAMYLEVGGSTDATPDVGIIAVLAEVAIQPATVIGIMQSEDFFCYVRQDPHSGAAASYLATTPAGTRGCTLTWTIDGVDGSQYVAPNTTYELVVGADAISNVTSVGLQPDPG